MYVCLYMFLYWQVWAIYAWCRRTDDIGDSPRALMNKEVLEADLQVWENRLSDIWADHPVDLFDLAMADTVKKYPGREFIYQRHHCLF